MMISLISICPVFMMACPTQPPITIKKEMVAQVRQEHPMEGIDRDPRGPRVPCRLSTCTQNRFNPQEPTEPTPKPLTPIVSTGNGSLIAGFVPTAINPPPKQTRGTATRRETALRKMTPLESIAYRGSGRKPKQQGDPKPIA